MTSIPSRRNIIFVIALLVLLAMLIYSVSGRFGVILKNEEPKDLTESVTVDSTEAIQFMFEQRVAVEKAAIEAQLAVGEVDWDLYLALGSDANFAGDLATSKWAYESLLQLNPISVVAWGSYARVLEEMGDLDAAEEAYWQAMNLRLASAEFQKYIAFLERHNEGGVNDDKILEHYELAVRILGQEVWSMVGLGEYYLAHGDCKHAIDHYEIALQLDPTSEAVASDLADVKEECRNQ